MAVIAYADLVEFRRPFVTNPGFVLRLKYDKPLAALDGSILFGGNEHGYTDYPVIDKVK